MAPLIYPGTSTGCWWTLVMLLLRISRITSLIQIAGGAEDLWGFQQISILVGRMSAITGDRPAIKAPNKLLVFLTI
jgi:hypothetical protein